MLSEYLHFWRPEARHGKNLGLVPLISTQKAYLPTPSSLYAHPPSSSFHYQTPTSHFPFTPNHNPSQLRPRRRPSRSPPLHPRSSAHRFHRRPRAKYGSKMVGSSRNLLSFPDRISKMQFEDDFAADLLWYALAIHKSTRPQIPFLI